MNFEESAKKLYTLPWQALYDLAVEKQIDGEEIKHKEKTEIIRRVLLSDITEAEIEAVIDDYTYGNRVTITQIKPPKKAIERCTNFRAMSRIVLQGTGGEKTAISNSSGFTEEQTREVERIQAGRFDTSGSYIAEINDETTATVKYNVSKGNLGIYKHLPSSVLFSWSKTAIEIILEEIENLKGRPAGEIFREMGVEIKWPGHASDFEELNWLLTQIISSLGEEAELRCTIPDSVKPLLQKEDLFFKIPRIYCNECESYELPYCAHCGEALTYNRKGVLECSCDAPLRVTCAEQHRSCEIKPWFLPKDRLVNAINKNRTTLSHVETVVLMSRVKE